MDLLLVVRGLAALSVVVWHAEGYQGELPALLNVPGRTAVWIFFGISGYVIAYGFVHRRYDLTAPDLRDSYVNRFLRIYPLFFVLSVLSWIIEFILSGSSPIGMVNLPAQFLAVQFNQDYVLSGVFWTLGIELHFYLLAPVLVLPLLMKKSTLALLIAVAAYAAVIIGYRYAVKNHGWSYDGRNIVANLPHFLTGMMACRVVSGFKPHAVRLWVTATIACALMGYTNWLYHNDPGWYWSARGILLVDGMIFLLVLAHGSIDSRKGARTGVYLALAFLGTLSYGIYAQHAYLIKFVPWLADKVLLLILSSAALAYVTYRLVEVPAHKLKRRHIPDTAAG